MSERSSIGDNSKDAKLMSFVERLERLAEEKRALSDDIKEVFLEAKGVGYNPKIMKLALKIRAMDQAKRAEEEEVLAVYLRALGIE